MFKRLLLLAAMGTALVACNPSTPGSSVDGLESPADLPSDAAPSMDASPSEDASPSDASPSP